MHFVPLSPVSDTKSSAFVRRQKQTDCLVCLWKGSLVPDLYDIWWEHLISQLGS